MPPRAARPLRRGQPANLFEGNANMAGKMRIAATLFLGTTVLATGGSAYYGLTHGWQLPSFLRNEAAPVAAATVPATATDLDAVASAWAEPASKHAAPTKDSSPVARSAKPEVAATEVKPITAYEGDRYASLAPTAAEASSNDEDTTSETAEVNADAAAEAVETVPATVVPQAPQVADKNPPAADIAEPEPTPAELEPVTLTSNTEPTEATSDAKTVDTEVKQAAADSTTTPTPIARGQEPSDDLSSKASDGSSDIGEAIDTLTTQPLVEPKPLDPPTAPV